MFEAQGYIYTDANEIKILDLLKNSDGISFRAIHIEDIPYYGIVAKVRDWQKQGLTSNIDGILGVTEQGIEYLNQLLSSKSAT